MATALEGAVLLAELEKITGELSWLDCVTREPWWSEDHWQRLRDSVRSIRRLESMLSAGLIAPGGQEAATLRILREDLTNSAEKYRRQCAEGPREPVMPTNADPAVRTTGWVSDPAATYYPSGPDATLAEGQPLAVPWQWFGMIGRSTGYQYDTLWTLRHDGDRYQIPDTYAPEIRSRVEAAAEGLPPWWPRRLDWAAVVHGRMEGPYEYGGNRVSRPTLHPDRIWLAYPAQRHKVSPEHQLNPTGEWWRYDPDTGLAYPYDPRTGEPLDPGTDVGGGGDHPFDPTTDPELPHPPDQPPNGNGAQPPNGDGAQPPPDTDPELPPWFPRPPPPDDPARPPPPPPDDPSPPPPDQPQPPDPDQPGQPPPPPTDIGEMWPLVAAGGGALLLAVLARRRRK